MLYNLHGLPVSELNDYTKKGIMGKEALEKAKYYFRDNDNENFVIILVEGYSCIAHYGDEFEPRTLDETIFPYDENRLYPFQGLELKYSFKRYF